MAKRKAKSKPGEEDAQPKKQGNPSNFKGSPLEFLTQHIPDYMEHSKKGKNGMHVSVANPSERRGSPAPDVEPVPKDTEPVFKALDLDLTLEEAEEKSSIQAETKNCWLGCQHPGNMGIHRNPDFGYLFYMRHQEFKEGVVEWFEELLGDELLRRPKTT
ncbi:hypothetical protein B0H19DRAFT_1057087 [Mycena capillaripes]|nr:hypothetical protein B0H19DRAFT_1057087 [Mycena capillaripes]